jgi:hypothetical protein
MKSHLSGENGTGPKRANPRTVPPSPVPLSIRAGRFFDRDLQVVKPACSGIDTATNPGLRANVNF